jgi:hypothetical protein
MEQKPEKIQHREDSTTTIQQPIETQQNPAENEKNLCNSPKRNKKEAGGSDRILIIIHSFIAYLIIKAGSSTNNKYGNGKGHCESVARTTTPPLPPPTPPLFNLHEYLQPVFDQLDELNKLTNSLNKCTIYVSLVVSG